MFVITINSKDTRELIKEMRRRLGERETGKAIASALNRVSAMGKTKASAQIRARYRIKKQDLDKRMGTNKASYKHLRAQIWSHGVPIPVHLFKYKQMKKGVRVTILGRTSVIPHAFVATMRNGHKGVFARGHYGPSGFIHRTSRSTRGRYHRKKGSTGRMQLQNDLPITQLTTVSQGPMFSHPTVIEPVMHRVEDMLGVRIAHELDVLLRGIRS